MRNQLAGSKFFVISVKVVSWKGVGKSQHLQPFRKDVTFSVRTCNLQEHLIAHSRALSHPGYGSKIYRHVSERLREENPKSGTPDSGEMSVHLTSISSPLINESSVYF